MLLRGSNIEETAKYECVSPAELMRVLERGDRRVEGRGTEPYRVESHGEEGEVGGGVLVHPLCAIANEIFTCEKMQKWLMSNAEQEMSDMMIASLRKGSNNNRVKQFLATQNSSSWLVVNPTSHHTTLTNDDMQALCLHRLSMPMPTSYRWPRFCQMCKKRVDERDCDGSHSCHCMCNSGMKIARHEEMKHAFQGLFEDAKLIHFNEPAITQTPAALRGDTQIPNGVGNGPIIVDYAVVDPARSGVKGREIGEAAEATAKSKRRTYAKKCERSGTTFIPVIMETQGFFHPEALKLVRDVARRCLPAERDEELRKGFYKWQKIRLEVALARAVAHGLRRHEREIVKGREGWNASSFDKFVNEGLPLYHFDGVQ